MRAAVPRASRNVWICRYGGPDRRPPQVPPGAVDALGSGVLHCGAAVCPVVPSLPREASRSLIEVPAISSRLRPLFGGLVVRADLLRPAIVDPAALG